MYYVYSIQSENNPDKYYVGLTTNVERRLEEHNSGGSIHTAKYQPWKIHAYFAFETEELAVKFEKYLKSHSGRAFASKHFWN